MTIADTDRARCAAIAPEDLYARVLTDHETRLAALEATARPIDAIADLRIELVVVEPDPGWEDRLAARKADADAARAYRALLPKLLAWQAAQRGSGDSLGMERLSRADHSLLAAVAALDAPLPVVSRDLPPSTDPAEIAAGERLAAIGVDAKAEWTRMVDRLAADGVARVAPAGDLTAMIDAIAYHAEPYAWTAEHMDEQHWLAVQAVMPRADELLDRCTAAEAGHRSAADALIEARRERDEARALHAALHDSWSRERSDLRAESEWRRAAFLAVAEIALPNVDPAEVTAEMVRARIATLEAALDEAIGLADRHLLASAGWDADALEAKDTAPIDRLRAIRTGGGA